MYFWFLFVSHLNRDEAAFFRAVKPPANRGLIGGYQRRVAALVLGTLAGSR